MGQINSTKLVLPKWHKYGTLNRVIRVVHDFLPNWMIFFHLSSKWCRQQKILFSADWLIIQKRKLYFSITKQCRYLFKTGIFNQEQLLYCTLALYYLMSKYPGFSKIEKQMTNPAGRYSFFFNFYDNRNPEVPSTFRRISLQHF